MRTTAFAAVKQTAPALRGAGRAIGACPVQAGPACTTAATEVAAPAAKSLLSVLASTPADAPGVTGAVVVLRQSLGLLTQSIEKYRATPVDAYWSSVVYSMTGVTEELERTWAGYGV